MKLPKNLKLLMKKARKNNSNKIAFYPEEGLTVAPYFVSI
jgi:hypothetical protein